jgi:hypothetical protein
MITDKQAFEAVKAALKAEYGDNIYINDRPSSNVVASFPAVSIVSSTRGQSRYSTFKSIEGIASVEQEVNVYANGENKDDLCEEIMILICDTFADIGYIRLTEQIVDNLLDASISRRFARFQKPAKGQIN